MRVITTTVSALYGGADANESWAFNDAANDLDLQHSISKLEFVTGWVVDGFRVTYRLAQGGERMVAHGRFFEDDVGGQVVTLEANEYISRAEGVHGRPNGQYDYGDCIQKIKFTIKDSQTGQERVTAEFGLAKNLEPADAEPFTWDGQLLAFAGRADPDNTDEVGLKGLSFVQYSGRVTVALSAAYAGDRPSGLLGQPYDDLQNFGTEINFQNPINKIVVWSGQVIDGLEVTYNLTNNDTTTVMHGAKGGSSSEIQLSATERIVEVTGLHGVSFPQSNWGDQVQLLSFKIYDSATAFMRTTRTFGLGEQFVQETRKDICVKGPIVGLAGTANNDLPEVGLNIVMFYTLVPAPTD